MITRRSLLEAAGMGATLAGSGLVLPPLFAGEAQAEPALTLSPALPEGTRSSAFLDALPGKKPLIKLTYRPPNYETPVDYFSSPITPNDAFFVRYHLADIPQVDATQWRLSVGGDGANGTAQLPLDDLKRLPAAEVVAVCQCSGNPPGLLKPPVPGGEWGFGPRG